MISLLKKQTERIFQMYVELGDYYTFSDSLRCSSVIFTVLLTSPNNVSINASTDFEGFETNHKDSFAQIEGQFPQIYTSYSRIKNVLDKKLQIDLIREHIKAIDFKSDHKDDLLAWFYQYSNASKSKKVFSDSLKKGKKIAGSAVLPVTQFFTDKYMVKRIITDALKKINDKNLSNIKVIDPACGGGNFLAFALEYLYLKFGNKNPDFAKYLVENILVGYDLDLELAGIAKLNLYLKYSKLCPHKGNIQINIFGGSSEDFKGFFDYKKGSGFTILSPWSEKEVIYEKIIDENSTKIYVTNPPFMGRRDMGHELKEYLTKSYPYGKSDLCISFINHCLDKLSPDDVLGVVSQTSWLYLSSYKEFRNYVLKNYSIETCYDLGSNAFADINGEKTNVALIIFSRKKVQSRFYYLKQYSYTVKKKMVEELAFKKHEIVQVDQSKFLLNKGYEILYLLTGNLGNTFRSSSRYSEFGIPMQGTSTGDNTKFIDFSWKKSKDQDWVLVSKGGGYCKWQGLNLYRVRWGKDASHIRNNQGSALRNISHIKNTQLVYSDTGTSGLSVRLLLKGQIFIASGPGIRVKRGNHYSHMGFLNSRFANFFIKVFSPKLTISAGYIGELPTKESILNCEKIAVLSQKCAELKQQKLSKKITNEEFVNLPPNMTKKIEEQIHDSILSDLNQELIRLESEKEIEEQISAYFMLSEDDLKIISDVVGKHACEYTLKKFTLDYALLDSDILKYIGVNASFSNGHSSKNILGVEGVLESLAHKYEVHPKILFDIIKSNVEKMPKVKQVYLADMIHKAVLYYLGFKSNYDFNIKRCSIDELNKKIILVWPNIDKTISRIFNQNRSLSDWINNNFIKHHKSSFLGKPLVNKFGGYLEEIN